MRALYFLLFFSFSLFASGQSLIDSLKSIEKKGLPFDQTTSKMVDGKRVFFKTGSSEPYTGVIYAKFPNGFYKTWREFDKGIGHGTYINFYKNGSPSEMGTYDDSKIEGPILKFHINGRIKEKGIYRNWRVKIGEWSYYDNNGKLIKKEDYGKEGDFSELEEYYKRGDIPPEFYQKILKENEFYQN